jgi:hypothetical protein
VPSVGEYEEDNWEKLVCVFHFMTQERMGKADLGIVPVHMYPEKESQNESIMLMSPALPGDKLASDPKFN